MAHCNHDRDMSANPIQRDIATSAVRNHQFTQITAQRPADEGMIRKRRNGLGNSLSGTRSSERIMLSKEIEESIEIGQSTLGIRNLQARRRLSGLGREGFLPAIDTARAAMYAWTSSAA